MIEWYQCRDEGRDVERLRPLCEEVEKHDRLADPVYGELAAKLVGEMEETPVRSDFPYEEPNELEAIRAARPAKRHIANEGSPRPPCRSSGPEGSFR